MKGKPEIIQALNELLTAELTTINQYFLAAKIYQNWGYERLYAITYKESIEEMKHADLLIARILFLEGLPNVQKLDKVHTGESVAEQLKADLANEIRAQGLYNNAVKLAREAGDNGTAELCERILKDTEGHVDFLESQMELIKQVGEANYLSQQIRKEA